MMIITQKVKFLTKILKRKNFLYYNEKKKEREIKNQEKINITLENNRKKAKRIK